MGCTMGRRIAAARAQCPRLRGLGPGPPGRVRAGAAAGGPPAQCAGDTPLTGVSRVKGAPHAGQGGGCRVHEGAGGGASCGCRCVGRSAPARRVTRAGCGPRCSQVSRGGGKWGAVSNNTKVPSRRGLLGPAGRMARKGGGVARRGRGWGGPRESPGPQGGVSRHSVRRSQRRSGRRRCVGARPALGEPTWVDGGGPSL